MAANTRPKTLQEAVIHYADVDVCQAELVAARWPRGVACPTCGRTDVAYLANQRRWQCKGKHPKRQFSAKIGTIFEDSPIKLSKWFVAIWLLASAKNGISSYELARAVGVTQKSAWFMMHRLRFAMGNGPLADKLRGVVEMDEAFLGGKRKNGKGRQPSDKRKAMVVALVERGGRARAFPMPRIDSENVHQLIVKHIDREHAELMTDESGIYGGDKVAGIPHYTTKHRQGEYVRGRAHSNSVEGFFSLFKRGIVGTFHHIGTEHLNKYCDEFAFRYTHRHVSDGKRAELMFKNGEGKRLTYRQPAAS